MNPRQRVVFGQPRGPTLGAWRLVPRENFWTLRIARRQIAGPLMRPRRSISETCSNHSHTLARGALYGARPFIFAEAYGEGGAWRGADCERNRDGRDDGRDAESQGGEYTYIKSVHHCGRCGTRPCRSLTRAPHSPDAPPRALNALFRRPERQPLAEPPRISRREGGKVAPTAGANE
jgi:hypothetical protein